MRRLEKLGEYIDTQKGRSYNPAFGWHTLSLQDVDYLITQYGAWFCIRVLWKVFRFRLKRDIYGNYTNFLKKFSEQLHPVVLFNKFVIQDDTMTQEEYYDFLFLS